MIPVTNHCRSPTAIKFLCNLGFNQYDITLLKESSVLKSITDTFEEKNMQTEYSVLGYKVLGYNKLTIKIDERGHKDRNIDHEIKRQKALEKELDCEFIRINPDEENFNISKEKDEIFRHIKESNKKLTEESTKKS